MAWASAGVRPIASQAGSSSSQVAGGEVTSALSRLSRAGPLMEFASSAWLRHLMPRTTVQKIP
jgi:hypothetical protein